MKASVFIATSLDGFIARRDGGIDWLDNPETESSSEDHGYHDFIASIDTIVMGRNSYEKVRSFGIPWPYEKPVVVLTSRPLTIPDELALRVSQLSGSVEDVVNALESRGAKHLYVDGGVTVQSFLKAGLIQRLIITTIPVLLGDGIRLFGSLDRDVRLRHVVTKTFRGGLVQTEYEVLPT